MNEQQLNQLEQNVINEFLARAHQVNEALALNDANHNDDNEDEP